MRRLFGRRQLQHGRHLALAKPCHQHDAPIRELQGVMMGIVPVHVDLTETRDTIRDLTEAEAWQQTAEAVIDLDVTLESELGARTQATKALLFQICFGFSAL